MDSSKKRRRNVGPRTPSLRAHQVRGVAYAYATFDGEERRYGRLDDEARQQFAEDLATWLANGRSFPGETVATDAGASFTVRDLATGYTTFTAGEYGPDWHENNEPRVRLALAAMLDLFGDVPAAEFGPLKLKAVREHLVSLKRDDGITPQLSVTTINERMRIIRTAFAWAVSDELVPASVLEGLKAVKTLRQGKPGTRGKRKVLPVERDVVDATLPYLTAPVAALVELMWWTGARPGELFGLRPCDLDRTGTVWTTRLEKHKTADKGKQRALFLGPKAQEILKPFLLRPAMRPLFRPAESLADSRRRRREHRQTPLWASAVARYEREEAQRPDLVVGEVYDAGSLRKSVQRAVVRVNRKRKADGLERLPMWTPYQLRHSAATRIRAEHGIEAARTLLGHTSAATTMIYAEADLLAAAKVMEQAG